MEFTNPLFAGTITRPWHICSIRLGVETLLLSTGVDADWGDGLYRSGVIAQEGFQVDEVSARISLINEDFSRVLPALRSEYSGGEVKVWRVQASPHDRLIYQPGYVEQGYIEGDTQPTPELIFDGRISEIPRADTVLEILAMRPKYGTFPRVRINTPLAHFTSRNGTSFTLAGKTYTVYQRGAGRG